MFKTKKSNTDYTRTKALHTIIKDFGYENTMKGMLPFTCKVVDDYVKFKRTTRKTRVEVSCTDHEYKNHAAAFKLKRAKELVEAESLSFSDLWKLVEHYKDVYCTYPLHSDNSYLLSMGDLWHLKTQIRIGLQNNDKKIRLIYKLQEVISSSSPTLISKYIDMFVEFLPKEDYKKTEEKLNLQEVKSFRFSRAERILNNNKEK